MCSTHYLGIDIGGSKIEAAVLNVHGGMLWRRRVAVPGEYSSLLSVVAGVVKEAEFAVSGQVSVGIGIPGKLSEQTGQVVNAPSSALNGQNFQGDVQSRLGRPVAIGNDANCFALSEATDGAGSGAGSVFGVILGTGVGGGLVINGRLIGGFNGIAGEWGHNYLDAADDTPGGCAPMCACGRSGHVEAYLSGPALARQYMWRVGTADAVTARDVVQRMHEGDAHAKACLAVYVENLARALASVINVLDPEVIVLGGGLSNVQELYDQVPQRWEEFVFSDKLETKLAKNKYGDASGVRGAAWLGAAA